MSREAIGFEKALKISKMVFSVYAADFPKWDRMLCGTPIRNDLSVRMAKAFSGLYTSPTMEDYQKMEIETGGPAFPTESEHQSGARTYHYEGMTLRDYFAARTLQSLLSVHEAVGTSHEFASIAYRYADAMLKAREQQS